MYYFTGQSSAAQNSYSSPINAYTAPLAEPISEEPQLPLPIYQSRPTKAPRPSGNRYKSKHNM